MIPMFGHQSFRNLANHSSQKHCSNNNIKETSTQTAQSSFYSTYSTSHIEKSFFVNGTFFTFSTHYSLSVMSRDSSIRSQYLSRAQIYRRRTEVCSSPIDQAPVVQKFDSTIHRINLYPLDDAIGFPNTYPLDSDLSG